MEILSTGLFEDCIILLVGDLQGCVVALFFPAGPSCKLEYMLNGLT